MSIAFEFRSVYRCCTAWVHNCGVRRLTAQKKVPKKFLQFNLKPQRLRMLMGMCGTPPSQ